MFDQPNQLFVVAQERPRKERQEQVENKLEFVFSKLEFVFSKLEFVF